MQWYKETILFLTHDTFDSSSLNETNDSDSMIESNVALETYPQNLFWFVAQMHMCPSQAFHIVKVLILPWEAQNELKRVLVIQIPFRYSLKL